MSSEPVAAFDVEDPPRTRIWRLVSVLFPFLLLTGGGWRRPMVEQPRFFSWFRDFRPKLPRHPAISQLFLFLLLAILAINTGVVYLFLSISSMTPFMHKHDGHLENVTLKPRVGHHWTYATICKYILQIYIIHYLCWRALESNPHVAQMRLQDPGGLNKPGLIHGIRKLWCYVFCYPFQEIWLSSHFIDHVLLSVTGVPYSLAQPLISWMHIELREKGIELAGALQGDVFIMLSGVLGLYSGALLVGFLCVTMGSGTRIRPGYAYIFQLSTLALAILMALEFLVQQQARQRYLQFHLKDGLETRYYNSLRVFMSACQLFASHSLCMLVGMHLGHAKHFQKCPDLPWRVACKEALGLLAFAFAASFLGFAERSGHLWPLCKYDRFLVAAIWECARYGLHLLAGLTLLLVGLGHSKELVDLGTQQDWTLVPSLMKLFDLDSFLVCTTYVASSLHLLVEVFDLFAERMYNMWALQILQAVFNLGLAVFTFAAWKQPPSRGLPRRCLWLALALVFESFMHDQIVEDCEFASAMPGCCAFPSITDVNADGGHSLWHMCALDLRCSHENPVSHSDNRSYFCKLPLDFHHDHSGVHARAVFILDSAAVDSYFQPTRTMCKELQERWSAFPDELKISESSEHEEAFSPVFKQFKLIGTAGRIEFYFALLGILMKVILFVEHPNSDEILHMMGESSH